MPVMYIRRKTFIDSGAQTLYVHKKQLNGRNSQVFGQAMKKRPTGHTLSVCVCVCVSEVLVAPEEHVEGH